MSLTSQQQTAVRGMVAALLLCGAVAIALMLAGCGKSEPAPTRPVFVARITLTGTSMLPLFQDGEEAALELCQYGDLRGGDPVAFWNSISGKYTNHVLVRRDATGRWITQGLNNPGVDRGHMDSTEFVGRTRKLRK